jgi:hypothetical protein
VIGVENCHCYSCYYSVSIYTYIYIYVYIIHINDIKQK